MKHTHWTILFIVTILFIFGVSWRLNTRREISYNTGNRQYSVILTNACVDAMKEVEPGLTDVFNTKEKRSRSLNAFYRSILKGFRKDNGIYEESIKEMTPFVLLIDNDGFYISYNAAFDEYMSKYYKDGSEIPQSFAETISAVTCLNTWSEKIGSDVIRFYLNDHVQVVRADNSVFDGTINEVSIACPDIALLKDKEAFETERRYVIIGSLEDEINYLLNSQPLNVGKYYKAYAVTLPQVAGEDWHRLIKRPCVISFLQGDIEQNAGNTLNVYAYAGGEVIKTKLFYGVGDLYYRYDGTETDNYGTMRDMAEKGYNPDITAMWDN